ncbi:Prostaglandin G/H synthase 1 [Porites harrisoni]
MTSGQALLVKLAKLVKELLQKLPYWWKLPIVLMMFYQIRQRDYLLSNNLFDAYSSQHTGPKYDCQDPLIDHMSLGCFKVKYLTPSYEKEDTTIEECVQHCKDKEYAYAGFDHSRQCYCVANLHTCELSQRKCRKRANKKCLPRNMIEVFRTMHCTENMRRFRTHDGTCNDLNQPASGSRFYRFGRNVNLTKTYEDTALLEPCPRQLSRKLMARDTFIPAKQLNLLAAGWIQFNLHDWFDHGPVDVSRRIRIELDEDDPVYNKHKGEMKIPRTKPDSCQMYSDTDSPTYQNDVTHWWDGSQLYGTDIRTNKKLRSFRKGKMKVGKDGWLPVNRKTGIDITGFSNNWWIGLSLMHNIFTREHNAICDMLLKFHPDWSDQQLYDIARLINTATIQKIHTVEWTPAILNNSVLRAGVYVNFGLSPGKEVFDWLAAHNISIEASGTVLKPIVGSPSKFYGVPFSLTEEFVSVYRMHPLLPDDLYMRSIETGQRTGKSYSLPEYSFSVMKLYKGVKDSS